MQVYKKDGIQLFNADALKVMDKMIEKGVIVDMVATDSPYHTTSKGNAGNSGGMLQKDIYKKGQVFKHNACNVEDWCPRVYKLLKDGGHCYSMTNHVNLHRQLNVFKENGFHFIKSIIWDKGNKIMGHYYMSQYEYILFFRKGKGVKINNCGTPDILSIPNKKLKDGNGKNLHDTEKPVELMKILVENSTGDGQLVLEPFVGIGATLLACKETGRRCIGCELDENYYNIAIKRLEGEI